MIIVLQIVDLILYIKYESQEPIPIASRDFKVHNLPLDETTRKEGMSNTTKSGGCDIAYVHVIQSQKSNPKRHNMEPTRAQIKK